MKKNVYNFFIIFTFLFSCNKQEQNNEIIDNNQTNDNINSNEISKEEGGIGFEDIAEAEGWESNPNYQGYGDPNAIPGGSLIDNVREDPATYRTIGPNSNNLYIWYIVNPAYQTLLGFDVKTNEYYPMIASHWKSEIIGSQQIAHFRIDPRARWWDGTEITADDVIATFNLYTDEGIQAPDVNISTEIYQITKVSKYIVKVVVDDIDWKKIHYFSNSHFILPASHLTKIDGAGYLEKYNKNQLMGSGPYRIDQNETKEGDKVVLAKVPNWWGYQLPYNTGMYNFDNVIFKIILDENMIKQVFKEGQIDLYPDTSFKPSDWFDEFNLDNPNPPLPALINNLIKKKVIFNYAPKDRMNITFNFSKPILNDKRFRQAIAYLWDINTVMEKVFRNDVVKEYSYWPMSQYVSPNLVKYDYDPERAAALLDEMGYTERDSDGTRMNAEGIKLEFDVPSRNYGFWVQTYVFLQDALKKAGIKVNLNSVDFTEWLKIMNGEDFNFAIGWYTGSLFPDANVFKTKLEDLTKISNTDIDALVEKINNESSLKNQIPFIQQIDQVLSEEAYYVYTWTTPYYGKLMYWDRFAYPETIGGLTATDSFAYWWIDQEKNEKINQFIQGDSSITLKEDRNLLFDPWNLKPASYNTEG